MSAPEGKNSVATKPVAVVAGGAGFLGSHLAEALLAQGFRVVVLDNYTTGKEKNLETVLGHHDFSFKVGDINKGLPELPQVDYIFHLAGVEEYINGTDVSVETLLVNSIGTRNLLEMAKAHQAKLILASSVDLYSGILSSLSLKNYFGGSRRDEERFSHHEAKRYAEALTTEYFKKFQVDARIVRLADVYGPRMDLRAGTEIAELLAEALQPDVKTLTVRGDGLKVLHPTYISDVIYGLIKAATGEGTNGKIFNLVSAEPQTVLNFASRLRQVAPHHPEIAFTADYAETRLPDHTIDFDLVTKELGWRAVIGLEEGLKRTLAYFRHEKITPDVPHPELQARPITPLNFSQGFHPPVQHFSVAPWLKNFAILLIKRPASGSSPGRRFGFKAVLATAAVAFFISIAVPVGGLLIQSGYGVWRLRGSEASLLSGQADPAYAAASSAEVAFNSGSANLADLSWIFQLLHLPGGDSYSRLLTSAKELSIATEEISQAVKPLVSLGGNLMATDVTAVTQPASATQSISEAETQLELADDHLAAAQTELSHVDESRLPGFVLGQVAEVKSKITSARDAITRANAGIKVLPEVIGLAGTRNYLLLFMNNNELRPGGGFIGSYGVVRFEGGSLRDITVDDIYNLDGELNSGIAAPAPLRDYLAVATLGLRDSNWSPDFPTNAKLAESLYFKATHRKIDGVIGMDIKTIQNLLRFTGPVTVADYNETITADNFFERAQYYSDVSFFAGSSGKRDFIGAVSRILLDKIFRSPASSWSGLAAALEKSLAEKDIVLYDDNAAVSQLLGANGWDGSVQPAPTSGKDTNDYLMVVDANVGGNKANYFVKNQANYQVEEDKNGGLAATLTLLYNHTATTETWPSGHYRDFLRVYAPYGAKLTNATESGSGQAPQVTTSTDLGKTVFSLFFDLPSSTQKEITLSYLLPQGMTSITSASRYHLTVQKQVGQPDPPFSFNFDVPTFLKATPSVGSNLTPYSVRYNGNLNQDLTMSVNVAP